VSMAVLCERVTNISIPEGRLDQELRYYVHSMESQADKAARGGVARPRHTLQVSAALSSVLIGGLSRVVQFAAIDQRHGMSRARRVWAVFGADAT